MRIDRIGQRMHRLQGAGGRQGSRILGRNGMHARTPAMIAETIKE
ncbi:hypothetical protein [Xanthomonas arboricola]|nr:hypothetical protein [Xanthomonas arboricola]